MLSAWVLQFLTSGFLNKAFDYFSKREDAQAQVAVAKIQAEIATRQAQKEILAVEEGWWVTSWIRPLIVYPFVIHIGAIVLDSTFKFHWGVFALPAPYDSLEQTVVASFFLTQPVEKIARNFLSYMRGN